MSEDVHSNGISQTSYGLARTADLDPLVEPGVDTFMLDLDLDGPVEEEAECQNGFRGSDHEDELVNEEISFLRVIFDRLDEDNSGCIERREIVRYMATISTTGGSTSSWKPKGHQSASDSLAAVAFRRKETPADDETLDFARFTSMMLASRVRSSCGYMILFLVASLLPVLYAANTRLLFIFVALEAVDERNAEFWQVSMVLGSYQTCRAFANAIIGGAGGPEPFRRCFIPMTSLALVGWIVSLSISQESVWALLVLSLVGLSETVVCLQDSLLKETRAEHVSAIVFATALSQRMRFQYVFISLGSTVAFIGGGGLYNAFGFKCICWFGACLSVTQIIIAMVYMMFGARAEDLGDTQPNHTHSHVDPHNAQLKLLAYKVAASVVLEQETTGKGPTRQKVAQILPVASRNKHVRVALQELYHSSLLQADSRSFGEDELQNIIMLGTTKRVEKDLKLNTCLPTAPSVKTTPSKHSLMSGTNSTSIWRRASIGIRLMSRHGKKTLSEHEFVSYMLPRVHLALHPESMLNPIQVPSYMPWVVATQAVMALCIGTFLSTSLLYYNHVHGLSTASVGICLGIGELMGATTILTVFLMTRNEVTGGHLTRPGLKADSHTMGQLVAEHQQPSTPVKGCCRYPTLRILASRPLHVPVILIVLALASLCFSLPSVVASIASQICMSSLNDLSVSLLNELTAVGVPPDKFKRYQSFGQWLRRLGNCLTGFLGPSLFQVGSQLPFVVFGCIVFIWSFLLWSVLLARAREITPGLDIGPFPPISAFRPFVDRKPWHVYERQYYHVEQQDDDHFGTASLAVRDLEYDVAYLRSQVSRLVFQVSALEAEVVKCRKEDAAEAEELRKVPTLAEASRHRKEDAVEAKELLQGEPHVGAIDHARLDLDEYIDQINKHATF